MNDTFLPGGVASQAFGAAPASAFSATLLPHRSLSRKGFVILIGAFGFLGLICGLIFALIGAWPVFGFFGLDVFLVYLAFRLNYRAGRLIEKVDLNEQELRITRVHPSGKAESWTFNPYWVRLELAQFENGADVLSLISHGRRFVFGAFLSDPEKMDFAIALKDKLKRYQ